MIGLEKSLLKRRQITWKISYGSWPKQRKTKNLWEVDAIHWPNKLFGSSKAHQAENWPKTVKPNKSKEKNPEDVLFRFAETGDPLLIKDRKTTKTKIKILEDTKTNLEASFADEIVVEVSITE